MHFVPHSLQNRKRRAPFGLAGLAVAAVIGYAFMHQPAPPQVKADTPAAKAIEQAQTAFGLDLLAHLTASAPGQNVVISPASIATILTLTMDGAGGTTRSDMARTLHLSLLPANDVNEGSKRLTASYANVPGVTLSVANALWADRGVTFAPAFLATAHDAFGADAQTLDFSNPSAADTINSWVDKNTQGHITQIVTPDVLRPPANVVLTNAVYFAGKWRTPFDKEATHDAPFTLADGSKVSVPMMAQEETRLGYQENADFQAVRLPYGDGRFAMDVFLPRGKLDTFLPTVTEKNWQTWSGAFRSTEVNLYLPRWKMQYAKELSEPLKSLGMGSAFGNADFTPMGLPGHFISAVLHRATIDVDETGTVATAATAVDVASGMAAMPPIVYVFRADHPFLFAITDTQAGALLFVGILTNPKTP